MPDSSEKKYGFDHLDDASDNEPVGSTESIVDVPRIEKAVREILLAIGEDPDREGLLQTPNRVARAYGEMVCGLRIDPRIHLRTVFHERYQEVVLLRDIPFNSICEHHLLPFMGRAHVAYLPDGKVVGLSKLARLVEGYARRPQVQERLTTQIADALMEELNPIGAACVIEAEHTCMTIPVDYEHRQQLLANLLAHTASGPDLIQNLLANMEDGRIKLFLIRTVLSLRREHPDLFSNGDHIPLRATGPMANNLFAFSRRHGGKELIVVFPRLLAGLVDASGNPPRETVWSGTAVILPEPQRDAVYTNVFTFEPVKSRIGDGVARLNVDEVIPAFPWSLLLRA